MRSYLKGKRSIRTQPGLEPQIFHIHRVLLQDHRAELG